MKHRSVSRATWLAATALALAARPAGAAVLDDVRDLPLVDQDGRRFTLRRLGARAAAVTFIATRCTDTCPMSEAMFSRLAREIARRRLDARLVLLTLDPAYDTPFVLARRARALRAAAPGFRLATAGDAHTPALLRAFGVAVRPDADGVPEMHDTLTYLLDGSGLVRSALPLSDRAPAAILADLQTRVG